MVELVNICSNVFRSSGFKVSFFSSTQDGDWFWAWNDSKTFWLKLEKATNISIFLQKITLDESWDDLWLWCVRMCSSNCCNDENDWLHWLHCATTVFSSFGFRRLTFGGGFVSCIGSKRVRLSNSSCAWPLPLPFPLSIDLKWFWIGVLFSTVFIWMFKLSVGSQKLIPCWLLSNKWFFCILTFGLPSNELNRFGNRIDDNCVASASVLMGFLSCNAFSHESNRLFFLVSLSSAFDDGISDTSL